MKSFTKKSIMYTYHLREMLFVSTCQKIPPKIAIYTGLVIFGTCVMILPHLVGRTKVVVHRHERHPTDLKYILIWNEAKRQAKGHFFINRNPDFALGQSMLIEQKCPHINCYITYDRNTLIHDEDFDAVVFDIDEVRKINIEAFNMSRLPDQVYVFRSMESPERYPICDRGFDGFFNWSWTFKLSSDIPQPFFHILDGRNTIVGPKKQMNWIEKITHHTQIGPKMKFKCKAVAWVVTKCKLKTKHQDFINELRNELKGYNYTLDIFGPCGQHKCSNMGVCQEMVEKKYYFQLVLEEYFSEDYVTNSIVSVMSHDTIPIILGTSDYQNFLPPGAYINAQLFDLKKLGALIDYLIKNHDKYEYFFDWRNHYHLQESPKFQVCGLCEKLNEINRSAQIYNNFRSWWEPEYKDVCQRLRLYKLFNTDNI